MSNLISNRYLNLDLTLFGRFRLWLSSKICPEYYTNTAELALKYHRVILDTDDLFHYCGSEFPDVDVVAYWLLKRAGYFSSREGYRHYDFSEIASLREQLRNNRESVRLAMAMAASQEQQLGEVWRGIFKVVEESGELLQLLGKLGAFPDGNHPGGEITKPDVTNEVIDLQVALDYFGQTNGLPFNATRRIGKTEKFARWGLSGIKPSPPAVTEDEGE